MTDPTLETAAASYRAVLSAPDGDTDATLDEIDITGYDRVGVPTVSVARRVRGPGTRRTSAHGVGYGASTVAATVGALGELTEEVLLGRHVRGLEPRRAAYADLCLERGTDGVADPATLVLPAGADADPGRPLDWVPVRRWRTGEEVLVPVEFVAPAPPALPREPPGGPLVTPITNGLGAGDSVERALSHALLELLQRDGNTVSYRALDTGVVIDTSGVTDPVTRSTLTRLGDAGIDVLVKLASTELATVVHAVGADSDPATPPLAVTAVGEAAHLDREAAVRKAVLEFAASRARRAFVFGPLTQVRRRHPAYLEQEIAEPLGPQEERALQAMTAWTQLSAADLSALLAPTVLARREEVAFTDLPTVPAGSLHDPARLLGAVLDRLADFDVLVAAVQVERDGARVHAVKAVVPGLEVETLSYGRIGERVLRRLLDRGSDLVGLGEPGPGQLPVVLPEAARERLGDPAWLDRARLDAVVGELYPLYREPDRHAPQRLAWS